MLYEGTVFPDVPDDAFVVHARGFINISANPFAKAYLFRNRENVPAGDRWMFRGVDHNAAVSEDVEFECRLLTFNMGLHLTEALAYGSTQAHATVELWNTDETGADVGAMQYDLLDRMFFDTAAIGSGHEVLAWRSEPFRGRHFPNPPQKALTFPRCTKIKVSVRTDAVTVVPANTHCSAELAVAIYPVLTPEQKGAGA